MNYIKLFNRISPRKIYNNLFQMKLYMILQWVIFFLCISLETYYAYVALVCKDIKLCTVCIKKNESNLLLCDLSEICIILLFVILVRYVMVSNLNN